MTPSFSPKLVAPAEGKTVMLFGVRFSYKVVSADSGGSLAALEVEIPPRTLVKPHSHSREDEFSLVISGTVGARVGDQVLEAAAGAYLVKPRGTPHAMWNTASVPARVVEILSPGGLEDYFEELAPILAEHRTPPEYYQLAERYGITIQDDWIEDLERAGRNRRYGLDRDVWPLRRARPCRAMDSGGDVAAVTAVAAARGRGEHDDHL
jgi:quercetin dioxygenase-like cupin family protein